MTTTTRLSIGALAAAAMTCGLLSAPAAHARTAETPVAASQTALREDPCGLFTRGGVDLYHNCNDKQSERIWVTLTWVGKNHFRCAPAGKTIQLGNATNVYNAYHDSWGCTHDG